MLNHFCMLLVSLLIPVRPLAYSFGHKFLRSSILFRGMTSVPITDEATNRLMRQTNAWCGLNGLMYTDGKITWTPAPLSLVPNVFSASAFTYATDVQPIINKLVDGISRDKEFLLSQLSSVSESDAFTMRIMDLYKQVPESIIKNGLQCGILRSDYMINNDNRPLQVEINTIASSFGYLSSKVSDYHRYILSRNEGNPALRNIIASTIGSTLHDNVDKVVAGNVVQNPSTVQLAKVLALAHAEFRDPKAVVMFIVQPGERNIADQRSFEAQLWNAHGVACEFLTLADIAARTYVTPGAWGANALIIRPEDGVGPEKTVSVAYYRAGYTPNDYPTETEWSARALIESSSAVKCPNAGYQLAGTKAIQASLCRPRVMEKFLTVEESALLRKCFAAQYSLVALTDTTEEGAELRAATAAAVQAATLDGAAWVLKPQREGGGNNFYGAELSQFLRTHQGDPVLSGYVLMQRIFPLPQKTAFLRSGALQILPSLSELGVYGTYLAYGPTSSSAASTATTTAAAGTTVFDTVTSAGSGGDTGDTTGAAGVTGGVIVSEYGGYLLRTKPDGVDEGGVASGYSVLNSIILD